MILFLVVFAVTFLGLQHVANNRHMVADGNREAEIMVAMHNSKIDVALALYEATVALADVNPSVEGNKVVLDRPELADMFGSIELRDNEKIFKNRHGQVYRREVFKPISCRMTLSYS